MGGGDEVDRYEVFGGVEIVGDIKVGREVGVLSIWEIVGVEGKGEVGGRGR